MMGERQDCRRATETLGETEIRMKAHGREEKPVYFN